MLKRNVLVLIVCLNILQNMVVDATYHRTLVEHNNSIICSSALVQQNMHKIQSNKLKNIFKYKVHCENCSRAKRSIDRILHRQKRYLGFPSGSAIVLTMVGVKGITFDFPAGYYLLMEVDIFYPLPDKIIRLNHRTTTTASPPPLTMPPELHDIHHTDYHDHLPTGWDHDHSNEIFTPTGGWQDDVFKNINDVDHPINANIDTMNASKRYWDEDLSYRNSYSNNIRPPSFQSKSRRRFNSNRSKRSTNKPAQNDDDHNNWDDYKSYRDRIELYSYIELIFENKGLQLRKCILRAICETKHFLLPKGKSLYHDIFRTIFGLPDGHSKIKDEYSNSVKNHDDSDNCWKLYETECPISILELLLKSRKIL